jgi:hypothetical protein
MSHTSEPLTGASMNLYTLPPEGEFSRAVTLKLQLQKNLRYLT